MWVLLSDGGRRLNLEFKIKIIFRKGGLSFWSLVRVQNQCVLNPQMNVGYCKCCDYFLTNRAIMNFSRKVVYNVGAFEGRYRKWLVCVCVCVCDTSPCALLHTAVVYLSYVVGPFVYCFEWCQLAQRSPLFCFIVSRHPCVYVYLNVLQSTSGISLPYLRRCCKDFALASDRRPTP